MRRAVLIQALGTICMAAVAAIVFVPRASSYPLDGADATGIIRLQGYKEFEEKLLAKGTLSPGALLPKSEIHLRLRDRPDFTLPTADPALSKRLVSLLGARADRYSVAVLDLSDQDAVHYIAHNPNHPQNPGSVGKLVVGLAWFQTLSDLHPADLAARAALLRETQVAADSFIRTDTHEVPFWQPGQDRIVKRPLREGDRGNLYTYLDWMFSSSSNAAASMLLQQLVLLRHFGTTYPVSEPVARDYLSQAPKRELQGLLMDGLREAIERNGLDPRSFRQGGLFTHEGKRRIPGGDSTSTAAELLRYLVLMEQGRLVDAWSSLELKRLLYLTERRIRYASHPALADAALYFKSGSLYQCAPEEGFVCKKYHGNVRNFMNSVAIVETRQPGRELHYLVAVLSNELRENSAVAHQTLALRIHRLIESLHPLKPAPTAPTDPADVPTPESRTASPPTIAPTVAPTIAPN